ncbi:dienelactone hydrolase family protein [Nocardia gipuzkoensis]
MDAYLARPRSAGPHPAVIVAHQIFGVTTDIGVIVDRLAELGYVAVAPDFYHRSERRAQLSADDAGRTQGLALMAELTREGVVADFRAAIEMLGARPDCTGNVGALGVSSGGHLAYLAAARLPLPVAVILYAGWLTGTDLAISRPEPTIELTADIAGKVVYVVGDHDHVVDRGQRTTIAEALATANSRHEFITMRGAPHAFLNESATSHNPDAARATWRLIDSELAAALRR